MGQKLLPPKELEPTHKICSWQHTPVMLIYKAKSRHADSRHHQSKYLLLAMVPDIVVLATVTV